MLAALSSLTLAVDMAKATNALFFIKDGFLCQSYE